MSWSIERQNQTREYLEDLAGLPNGDKIHLKNQNGQFGYIKLDDWLHKNWLIHQHDNGESHHFATVEELLKSGWVID